MQKKKAAQAQLQNDSPTREEEDPKIDQTCFPFLHLSTIWATPSFSGARSDKHN